MYNTTNYDIELWNLIKEEILRQEEHIELIASENYISVQAMKAQGSQLTNKYAEGYPGNRYYGGCQYIDLIEQLAIDRAKKLFSAKYANVQPHSGSQANFSVYHALLKPGDTIIGMHLNHGGHLTHGSQANFSGKLYKTVFYGIDTQGNIDYEQLCTLSKKFKPKMIIGGFSAYSGIVDWARMRQIADSVNAYLLVDMAHIAGLVAAKVYPNPVPYAHVVTSTTHKTLGGPRGGLILSNGFDESSGFYKKLNTAVFPGSQGGPLMHVIAAKAIAFKEAMSSDFKQYQHQIIKNAQVMSKEFLKHGHKIVSGKVNNHLFVLDLTNYNITGKDASLILESANIVVNKNCIPYDSRTPLITSGIRIGTAAVTRRKLKEKDVQKLACWICDILSNVEDKELIVSIKNKVLKMCGQHPVYTN